MKKTFLVIALCLAIDFVYGQQPAANPFPKTISVSGSAEMEIVPDEIYVNIVLREYQKRGESKKELDALKNDFLAACKTGNIPDSTISIVSYTGYNDYLGLRKKKKSPDLFASITYQVKFSNSKQMDELVDKLDDEATQSFNIVNTSHSKMTEFRKQLKTQAVIAAKNKATYLTDAINEKLGAAITIKEPNETGIGVTGRVRNFASQAIVSYESNERYDGNANTIEVDFKKIKLRYEVDVIFALQ